MGLGIRPKDWVDTFNLVPSEDAYWDIYIGGGRGGDKPRSALICLD